MFPLISNLSVFFRGVVQVRKTWSPVRVAARLVTGSGSFNEGGNGAPGVPQPASASPITIPAAAVASAGVRFPIRVNAPSVTLLKVYWSAEGSCGDIPIG